MKEEKLIRKTAFDYTKEKIIHKYYLEDTGLGHNAPKHATIQDDTAICCQFCMKYYNTKIIEDEIHVCIDCPLNETYRKEFLKTLHQKKKPKKRSKPPPTDYDEFYIEGRNCRTRITNPSH